MTRKLAVVFFELAVLGAALPLLGAASIKQSFEVIDKQRCPVAPGATLRLENSYGYVTVEGWDEPEMEVTLTKSTDRFYEPEEKDKAGQHFDEVRLAAERRSDKELVISTRLPARNSLLTTVLPSGKTILTTPVPPNNKRGVTVEYTVHVPRDSRVVVHNDNGYVWVSDVTGDIEVRSHTGDMIVMLPDPDRYSIDAATRVGSVLSDFAGEARSQFLLGTHYTYRGQTPSRHVLLRMGRGSITIKNGPASGPLWKD